MTFIAKEMLLQQPIGSLISCQYSISRWKISVERRKVAQQVVTDLKIQDFHDTPGRARQYLLVVSTTNRH